MACPALGLDHSLRNLGMVVVAVADDDDATFDLGAAAAALTLKSRMMLVAAGGAKTLAKTPVPTKAVTAKV